MGLINSNMLTLDNAQGGYLARILLKHAHRADFVALDPRIEGFTLLTDRVLDAAVIDDELVRGIDIAVIEISPGDATEMSRLADLKARHPDLPIIAALSDTSLHAARGLMRLGVRDILEMPISVSSLTSSLSDVIFSMRGARNAKGEQLAPMISVIKSIGGVGATNVATHLASMLSRGPEIRTKTCIFDLDVQFGNVATYLGLQPELTLSDLLSAGARVDGDLLSSTASSLPDGLAVFPAPAQIGPLEAIDSDQLLKVLSAARRNYGAVVADMPSNWSNWTLSVVAQSSLIVLVINLSIASLRQGRRQLNLLLAEGIHQDRVKIVANRVEKRLFQSINLDDAARVLGLPIEYTVQNDYQFVNGANDRGLLVDQVNARSKVTKDYQQMAASIGALIGAQVK